MNSDTSSGPYYIVPWDATAGTGGFCGLATTVDTYTSTTYTSVSSASGGDSSSGSDPCGCETSNSYTCNANATYKITLSNEYTKSALISNTIAALPTMPDLTEGGSPVSSFTLSTDEKSATIERSKYEWHFKPPTIGTGECYKLTWAERYTPKDGDPVDTVKTWTWDGVIPGDYDPADKTTFPKTEMYSLTEDTSKNGETTIGYYTDPDDPDTFVEGHVLEECTGCV